MGLTIHFTLDTQKDLLIDHARDLVERAWHGTRALKGRLKFRDIGSVCSDAWARKAGIAFVPYTLRGYGPNAEKQFAEVMPRRAFIFAVNIGDGCEPLCMGLCRYPPRVLPLGRTVFTNLQGSWRLQSFCKTQFASLHGWEHFRRCHLAVIELLCVWDQCGVPVEISDEGEYWPRRSLTALRRNLDEMNGVVAAAAGALKDMADESDKGRPVRSPIFAHPQFERLEAEGERKVAPKFRRALRSLKPESD